MSYKKIFKRFIIVSIMMMISTISLSLISASKMNQNNSNTSNYTNKIETISLNQNSLNIDKTIITSVIDSQKDTNYPWQNEYTNKRAAGNDFNLPMEYWHISKKPLLIASIDVQQMYGYQNLDQFWNDYQSINLDYIFNANFWSWIVFKKKWVWNQDNPKNVSLDKWQKSSFSITKQTKQESKFISNHYGYRDLKFNNFISKRYPAPDRFTKCYVASGVHVWYQKNYANNIIYLFAETGVYFGYHPSSVQFATYMNFKAEDIRLIKR